MARTGSVIGVIVVVLIIAIWLYTRWTVQTNLPPINTDRYKVIGVIDFSNQHKGPNFNNVRQGIDPVLVVDHTQPYYGQLIAKNALAANNPTLDTFHLQLNDDNKDGLLDNEDAIWSHLYILVYDRDTQNYAVKSLPAVGIRAIVLKHLTRHGNHTVILSNGAERTLYELR